MTGQTAIPACIVIGVTGHTETTLEPGRRLNVQALKDLEAFNSMNSNSRPDPNALENV
jgi:hypothetical protein